MTLRGLTLCATVLAIAVPGSLFGEPNDSRDIYEFRVDDEFRDTIDCSRPTPPRYKIRVEPKYPISARKEGKIGIVIVSARMTQEGNLIDVKVVESDDAEFSRSALESLKRSIFEPAKCGEHPVAVTLTIRFNFKLVR